MQDILLGELQTYLNISFGQVGLQYFLRSSSEFFSACHTLLQIQSHASHY